MKSVMGYGAGFQALSLTTCVSHATLASSDPEHQRWKGPEAGLGLGEWCASARRAVGSTEHWEGWHFPLPVVHLRGCSKLFFVAHHLRGGRGLCLNTGFCNFSKESDFSEFPPLKWNRYEQQHPRMPGDGGQPGEPLHTRPPPTEQTSSTHTVLCLRSQSRIAQFMPTVSVP